jgi:Protein of unknown function (DUF3035)
MRASVLLICGGVALPLSLSGCSDVKQAFGLQKTLPDEFDVVSNAPLAIPPDFNLRPPSPGAPPTQGESPTAQAKETIFRAAGQTASTANGDAALSPGESDILQAAGATGNQADIRQVVNEEAAESHPFDNSFVDRLMFWRQNKKAQQALLDPVKETARLEQTSRERTIATQFSAPPTVERKSDSGSFLGLF